MFRHKVITGYANGIVKIWDIHTEDPAASLGSLITESEVCEEHSVTSVCMSSTLCAAGYNNGKSFMAEGFIHIHYCTEVGISCAK